MTFTPTPEQEAIVAAAVGTSDNLIINALAGAAKTSTLVLIAKALMPLSILCLAFNKKIAEEMKERLPPNCQAMTLNSLGHRVWGEAIGRRLQISPSKVGDLVKTAIADLQLDRDEEKALWEAFPDLIRTISFGKACGYLPTGYRPERGGRGLMDDGEFFAHYEEKLSPLEQDLVRSVTIASLDAAWQGNCDYDDQIYMPTIFGAVFPRFPLVLIDEAQDLSALNHATLRKLAKKRLIAVGDPCQAIYGFRGAHEESMELLAESFKMKSLFLTVSFRCPIKIVEHARFRAPSMQYPTWAKEGAVSRLGLWSISDLPEDAVILCRNNAPLFAMAIKLLKHGRYPQLVGNDIGKGLLAIMKKFGDGRMAQSEALDRVTTWEETKVSKSRNPGPIRDRAECMRIFLAQGKTLGDAIAYAEHIFNSMGPIKLMTGHKSKGLEFDNVFILNRDLLGDEGQERNLRYVMITRSKSTLTYIDSEDLSDEVPLRTETA